MLPRSGLRHRSQRFLEQDLLLSFFAPRRNPHSRRISGISRKPPLSLVKKIPRAVMLPSAIGISAACLRARRNRRPRYRSPVPVVSSLDGRSSNLERSGVLGPLESAPAGAWRKRSSLPRRTCLDASGSLVCLRHSLLNHDSASWPRAGSRTAQRGDRPAGRALIRKIALTDRRNSSRLPRKLFRRSVSSNRSPISFERTASGSK